jgi:hypothetical protein
MSGYAGCFKDVERNQKGMNKMDECIMNVAMDTDKMASCKMCKTLEPKCTERDKGGKCVKRPTDDVYNTCLLVCGSGLIVDDLSDTTIAKAEAELTEEYGKDIKFDEPSASTKYENPVDTEKTKDPKVKALSSKIVIPTEMGKETVSKSTKDATLSTK